MSEFYTRAGTMTTQPWMVGLTVYWQYENGLSMFDGSRWTFQLFEGVRK
jgi:hypothetical protein